MFEDRSQMSLISKHVLLCDQYNATEWTPVNFLTSGHPLHIVPEACSPYMNMEIWKVSIWKCISLNVTGSVSFNTYIHEFILPSVRPSVHLYTYMCHTLWHTCVIDTYTLNVYMYMVRTYRHTCIHTYIQTYLQKDIRTSKHRYIHTYTDRHT